MRTLLLTVSWGLLTLTGVAQDQSPAVEVDAAKFESLQAAVDALPLTGGIVKLPPQTYTLQSPLIIRSENTRIEGSGAATHLINANSDGQPAIHIRPEKYAENPRERIWRVQLGNFRVSGNPGSGTGILAQGVQEIFIHGVSVDHHGGHGIFLDNCYEDPRVADSILTYNAQSGLHLVACHDIVVNGNHFEENLDALTCLDSFNLTCNGNNLDDHLRHGIVIENTYGSVVSGNMIEECNGIAIVLDRDCYGTTLSANVIAHDMQGGIDLRDAWGCTVSANTFTIVHEFGVRVAAASGRISITGNNFCNSAIGDGKVKRKLEHPDKVQIDTGHGVLCEATTDNVISGNMFSGMDGAAVTCTDECQRISVTGNIATDWGRRTPVESPFLIPTTGNCLVKDNIVSPASDGQSQK